MNGDPNMETLYEWALEYQGISSMPTNLENDTQKLIEIIDMIGYCIGNEFDKDKATYKQQHGKDPTPEQEPYIIVFFKDYDTNRKQEFLECIKKCLQGKLSEIDERYQMNFVLKLWSGCLSTAKILSPKTQSGLNTAETRTNLIALIDSRAATDTIYRKGVEIACIWQPDPKNVSFDRVPHNSSTRKYESAWSKRDRERAVNHYTSANSESN